VVIAALLFGGALLVALDLYLRFGEWFNLADVHHETWMIALAFAGLVAMFI
jgi:hypothetical protein